MFRGIKPNNQGLGVVIDSLTNYQKPHERLRMYYVVYVVNKLFDNDLLCTFSPLLSLSIIRQ